MEEFLHVRVLIGMVLGLSITRLLGGLARFVQHPGREKIYWVHLGWALSLFLLLVHFWWWEFRLAALPDWTCGRYFFLIGYTTLFYLLCTLLFPDDIRDFDGFRDYFLSRRRWFFSLLALSFAADFIDTLLKGRVYFDSLGIEYPLRNLGYIALCLMAIRTDSERFHRLFVVAGLLYEISWIARLYDTLP